MDAYAGVGVGAARDDTHRLLDSRPVRAVLAACGEASPRSPPSSPTAATRTRWPAVAPAATRTTSSRSRRRSRAGGPAGRRGCTCPPLRPLYDRRVLGDHVVEDHETRRAARRPGPSTGR
ncbi:hypothetical protein NKH77_25655 [Streptomyces sp. M19]